MPACIHVGLPQNTTLPGSGVQAKGENPSGAKLTIVCSVDLRPSRLRSGNGVDQDPIGGRGGGGRGAEGGTTLNSSLSPPE